MDSIKSQIDPVCRARRPGNAQHIQRDVSIGKRVLVGARQIPASSPEQIAKCAERKVHALCSRVGLTDVGEKQRLET